MTGVQTCALPIYQPGSPAIPLVAKLFPTAVENHAISRPKLRALIAAEPAALNRLQAVIHPLVAADRAQFLVTQTADIVLLDIPLLYETGADAVCDAVAVVSCAPEVQRTRVMARGTMTEAEFALILSRQLPDAEKRARADFIIDSTTLDGAQNAVQTMLQELREKLTDA